MELSEHVLDFEKRSAIKSQFLVDFIADWTEPTSYTEGPIPESPWHIYYDRAWGNANAGAVTFLISPLGINLRYTTQLQFTKETNKCTNNIAEYLAVLLGFCKQQAIWTYQNTPKASYGAMKVLRHHHLLMVSLSCS
ncbi:hypothetical protein, partial [Arcobacter sp.]|uniref:hypothetical protein n=1 Tax=Arcobacter sp. TaxID=1872629 RepID=UPI003D09D092